jgi:hypothetical protein
MAIDVLDELLAELGEVRKANDPTMLRGSFVDALWRRKVDQLERLAICFLHAELPNIASICSSIATQKRLSH